MQLKYKLSLSKRRLIRVAIPILIVFACLFVLSWFFGTFCGIGYEYSGSIGHTKVCDAAVLVINPFSVSSDILIHSLLILLAAYLSYIVLGFVIGTLVAKFFFLCDMARAVRYGVIGAFMQLCSILFSWFLAVICAFSAGGCTNMFSFFLVLLPQWGGVGSLNFTLATLAYIILSLACGALIWLVGSTIGGG